MNSTATRVVSVRRRCAISLSLAQVLRRPEISLAHAYESCGQTSPSHRPDVDAQVEIEVKYQGYVDATTGNRRALPRRWSMHVCRSIPDYPALADCLREVCEKFTRIKASVAWTGRAYSGNYAGSNFASCRSISGPRVLKCASFKELASSGRRFHRGLPRINLSCRSPPAGSDPVVSACRFQFHVKRIYLLPIPHIMILQNRRDNIVCK